MDSAERFPSCAAMLGRLPARAAHDLNNLIAILGGNIYLARSPGDLAESLGAMETAVAQLERLSKSLAALGAVGGGQRRPLSVNALAQNAAEGNAAVQLDLADPLPPVAGNEEDLTAALGCLIANAVEAAGPGGAVRVSTRAQGNAVLLAVEDSGPGIAPAIADRVFDPLFSARGGRGAGMGLFLVAAVTHAHATSCRLEPAAGGGTRASILLPGAV
jgi:signal transduction histidine kinase